MIDVEKTLDKILGKVEVKELLWTNPNPNADFPAQTISLALIGYDEVEIYARGESANRTISSKCAVGNGGFLEATTVDEAYTATYRRDYDTTTNAVIFGNSPVKTTQGFYAIVNGANIPIKIYGIKWGGYSITQLIKALFLKLKGGVA